MYKVVFTTVIYSVSKLFSNSLKMSLTKPLLRPIIAVDIDEVLAAFMPALVSFSNNVYGSQLTTENFNSYDFHEVWGGTREESINKMESFFISTYFKETIGPVFGAVEAMSILKNHFDLHVVTSRQFVIEDITRSWILKYFPNTFINIHFGNHYAREGGSISKPELCRRIGAQLLIDDSAKYANECAAVGLPVILFGDYAWNRGLPVHSAHITRAPSWYHVLGLLFVNGAPTLPTVATQTPTPTPSYQPTSGREIDCSTVSSETTDHQDNNNNSDVDNVVKKKDDVAQGKDDVIVAVVQMCSTTDKEANFASIERLLSRAVRQGAQLVCFPENAVYLGQGSTVASEPLTGPSVQRLCKLASQYRVHISICVHERVDSNVDTDPGGQAHPSADPGPEVSPRIHNTHLMIGPSGALLASYRKIHLFDSPLTGHKESSVTVPGDRPVVCTISCQSVSGGEVDISVGLTVCYDLRFPELFRCLREMGAELLLVPSAFTMRTGAHWRTLLRARAIETQSFVLAAAQAGQHNPSRASHGEALAADCWGTVVSACGATPRDDQFAPLADPWGGEEALCIGVFSRTTVHKLREQMPVLEHRKPDTYSRYPH